MSDALIESNESTDTGAQTQAAAQSAAFRQVIAIGVRDFGAGAQDDAAEYRDRGASTLSHVAAYLGGVHLPTLQWMGLGNIVGIRGVDPAEPPSSSHGMLIRSTSGSDPAGALAEALGGLLGLVSGDPDPDSAADVPLPEVHLVGGAIPLIGDDVLATRHELPPSGDLADVLSALVHQVERGIIVAVEPVRETDGAGPVGIARAWERLDGHIARILDHQADDALLLIFSLSGNDATIAARSGQTREFSPVLAYTPALPSGVDLGGARALADLGATVAEILGVSGATGGASFYGQLIA